MREGAKWGNSAEYRGWRMFNGQRYRLYNAVPTKKRAKALMKGLKDGDVAQSVRCTKSLYYNDWNVWIRGKR